ncbi:hypothetical protein [Anaerovibrio sp.]|uniref:hypothetical protein n=1 Tax=Anaerovibrio sp. TaxID=1872532 RepID=UPI003F148D80
MRKNKTGATPSEASMDGIQLVASLLMCFPEMGKVTLDSKDEGVWLDFTLKGVPGEERMRAADKLITDSLRFYHEIEGISGAKLAFYYEKRALHIFRDIGSLSRAEIGILVTLIKDNFGDLLLTDAFSDVDEDVLYNQSEMIDHRIRFLRENHIRENMVGIREEGRVMVY